MLKILLRTLIILLVTGLVAGGIYLLVEKAGLSISGSGGLIEGKPGDFEQGNREFDSDQPEQPKGSALENGKRMHHKGGHGGENGFSWQGLGGVAIQAGKIFLITAVVIAFQAVLRLFKRRSRPAAPANT